MASCESIRVIAGAGEYGVWRAWHDGFIDSCAVLFPGSQCEGNVRAILREPETIRMTLLHIWQQAVQPWPGGGGEGEREVYISVNMNAFACSSNNKSAPPTHTLTPTASFMTAPPLPLLPSGHLS